MKKWKGCLSLAVAAMTVVVTFSGCGTGTRNSNGTATTAGSSTTTAAAAQGTSPAQAEPATLTVLTYALPTIDFSADMPVMAETAKQANINIEWQNLPTGDATETKLKLVFASNELPDVLLYGSKDIVDRYGQQGALIPLEDLVEINAPNIKQAFAQLEQEIINFRGKISASDGHIYTIPSIVPAGYNTGEAWAIREDWCKNVGLAVPKTTDELYQVLKAFKEKDPNKNGKADEIPLIHRAADYYVMIMSNSFGTCTDVYWDDNANQAKFGPVQPEMKDALAYISKLFKEKLLDNEYITNTDDQWIAKMSNDQAGMMYGWAGGQIGVAHDALKKMNPEFNLVPMLPVTGPGGVSFKQDGVSRINYRGSITKSCKNIDAAMHLFDFSYSQAGADLGNWGIEGKTYTRVGDKKQILDYVNKNPDGLDGPTVMKNIGMNGPLPRLYDAEALDATSTVFSSSINKLYGSIPGMVKEGWSATLTEEESKTITKYNNDLFSNYIAPMTTKFIMGKEPISNWDAYIAKAKQLGVDEYIKIYDTAYRRSNNIK